MIATGLASLAIVASSSALLSSLTWFLLVVSVDMGR